MMRLLSLEKPNESQIKRNEMEQDLFKGLENKKIM
jgi:hypothetical protein